MNFQPLIFSVTIAGNTYRFAALTHKDVESLIEQEQAAKDDAGKMRQLQAQTLAAAINKAGEQTTAAEIMDTMPMPVFISLYTALLKANGLKLDAEPVLGESVAS